MSKYSRYWYCCDDIDDTNWGCGWRCMQMILSKLFSTNKNIELIKNELISLGFDFPAGKSFGYLDGTMIEKYFIELYNCTIKSYEINNVSTLDKFIEQFNGQNKEFSIAILIHDGYIVVIDDAHKENVYILDPHIFEDKKDKPNKHFLQKIDIVGKGGEGWKNLHEIIFYNIDKLKLSHDEFLSVNPPQIYIISK